MHQETTSHDNEDDVVDLTDIQKESSPVAKKSKSKPTEGRPTNASKGLPCSDSVLRRWMLVTLSHTEKQDVDIEEVVSRLQGAFDIQRGVGAVESHSETLGEHFHVAFECSDGSRKTAVKIVRALFPEFEGRGVNLKFHRCFATMLKYVTKEDQAMERCCVFGDYNREEALLEIKAKRGKKLNAVYEMRRHVEAGESMATLAYNDDVAPFLMTSAGSVFKFRDMIERAQKKETTLEIIARLAEDGVEETGLAFLSAEQLSALEEFVRQLNGRRHRDPQLYCVGDSGTGKSYLFQLLAGHTRAFIPCLENGDRAFADYRDESHDWIFINDFHDNVKFQLLSNLCEGGPYTLNSYGMQVKKLKNCPVVFTANDKPVYRNVGVTRQKAINSRMKFVEFTTPMMESREEISVEDLCAVMKKWI